MELEFEMKKGKNGKYHFGRVDGTYGCNLEDVSKQLEYNMRNGITTIIKGEEIKLEPSREINNSEDIVKYLFSDKDVVPELTLYLADMLSGSMCVADGERGSHIWIDGEERFFTCNMKNKGGLDISPEKLNEIERIVELLQRNYT